MLGSRFALLLAATFSLVSSAQEPGPILDGGRSEAQSNEIVKVFDRPMQLSLSPGLINYDTFAGNNESRFLMSALTEWNFGPVGALSTPVQYGVGTGLMYSHVGAPQSNFFGASGPSQYAAASGDLFIVPLELWAGYHFREPGILVSLHPGANAYFRTDVDSMQLGRESDRTGGAVDFFPSIAARVGWDLKNNMALTLKTDWTLTPRDAVFSGMLGATIPLG